MAMPFKGALPYGLEARPLQERLSPADWRQGLCQRRLSPADWKQGLCKRRLSLMDWRQGSCKMSFHLRIK
jgi:hypothetical protein